MATRTDLKVSIAAVEATVTDAKNAVLAMQSRVETILADLRKRIEDGPDMQLEIDHLNAVVGELNSIKATVDSIEPPLVI